jgi:branched-chain amino acid transport system permease protein
MVGLILLPILVRSLFWLTVMTFIGIYLIFTVGLTLLMGYANQISFGHGAFFGVGAYVSSLLAIRLHVPVPLAIVAATLAAAAAGYVVGRPIMRLRGLSLAMATFAVGQIGFILFTSLPITNGPLGLPGIPALTIGPLDLEDPKAFYWLVLLLAVAAFAFTRNIARSHVGRVLRAIGTSEVAASVTGINVAAYKVRIFTFSVALAGLAGAVYAHYISYISSDSFTLDLSILAVIMVAVGGIRSLWGAVAGAAFITVVPEYLRDYSQYSTLLYGFLLTMVFMYFPSGLVGLAASTADRLGSLSRRHHSNR